MSRHRAEREAAGAGERLASGRGERQAGGGAEAFRRAPTAATEEFRRARDLLLSTRTEHDAAYLGFRWPRPLYFNWALEWFDVVASGNGRDCLRLVDPDGTTLAISYAEMAHRSDAVASWLLTLGVRRGDRVLIVLGTQRELWECLLACLKLGAVAIPTYTTITAPEAEDRIRRGRIRHVICRDDLVGLLPPAGDGGVGGVGGGGGGGEGNGDGRDGGARVAVGSPVPGWHRYAQAFAPARAFQPALPTPAADVAFGYFTSGTTRAPKLVAHTHASYPIGHLSSMYWNGLLPGDRHLNVSAPGWAKHSWSSLFVPWNAEASIVAGTSPREPGELARMLVDHAITSLCAPPSTWYALAPYLDTVRPGDLREATSAGEPLDAGLAGRVERAWGVTVRDGYGQTETTGLIGTTPGMAARPGWLGRPLPGFTIRVGGARTGPATGEVEVDLSDVPVGMMRGYLGDEERTAAAYGDGRYRTGDLGEMDEHGWVRIAGRADDVFKSFGHRVSPYELEAVLREHPAVAEVAVVAQPDPAGSPVPHAVVVARPAADHRDLPEALLAYLRERVAPAVRPRAVHLTDRLPRTASGKIRRSAVARWLCAGIAAHPPRAGAEQSSGHIGCPGYEEVNP